VPLLIAADAMTLIEAAESPDAGGRFHHGRAVARLDDELGSPRRFALGFVGLLGIVAGGMLVGLAADSFGDDDALAVVVLIVGLAIGVPGALLGLAVVRAGERVCRAYTVWVADDAFGSPVRGTMVERLFSGRSVVRSALAAFALIAAVFAWALLGLSVAPSGPVDVEGLRVAMVTMSLVWAVALTASTFYLVAGEVRTGWAHSQSVIRGR
jgi:hypothetical protein